MLDSRAPTPVLYYTLTLVVALCVATLGLSACSGADTPQTGPGDASVDAPGGGMDGDAIAATDDDADDNSDDAGSAAGESDAGPGAGGDDGDDAVATVPSECGDDVCDEDENVFSCRDDCDAPDWVACLGVECTDAFAACTELDDCTAVLSCMLDCDEDGCIQDCVAGATGAASFIVEGALECGREAECFGDVPQPPAADSCVGLCGEFVDDKPCGCDTDCVTFGDCCDDYEDLCVEDTGGGGPVDVEQCVQDECGGELSTCFDTDGCVMVIECANECEGQGQDCIVQCIGDVSQAALQAAQQLRQCVVDNCTEGGGPECGDGDCDGDETPTNCPADCEGGDPGGGLVGCLEEMCGSEVAACDSTPECQPVLDCLDGCADGDQGCQFECAQLGGFNGEAIALATCSFGSGCLAGGGGGGGPECGDGSCDDGESADNCPEDCDDGGGGGGASAFECLVEECGDAISDCLADEECAPVVECAQDCDPDDTDCLTGCAQLAGFNGNAIAIGTCGFSAGCFSGGGGGTDGGGTDGGGGGGGTDSGGGGGTLDLITCLGTECGTEFAECIGDSACQEALGCLATCDPSDSGCYLGCAADAGLGGPATDLALCAVSSGCFGG